MRGKEGWYERPRRKRRWTAARLKTVKRRCSRCTIVISNSQNGLKADNGASLAYFQAHPAIIRQMLAALLHVSAIAAAAPLFCGSSWLSVQLRERTKLTTEGRVSRDWRSGIWSGICQDVVSERKRRTGESAKSYYCDWHDMSRPRDGESCIAQNISAWHLPIWVNGSFFSA